MLTPLKQSYRDENGKFKKYERKIIKCFCGCNQEIEDRNKKGRLRKYIWGHGGSKFKKNHIVLNEWREKIRKWCKDNNHMPPRDKRAKGEKNCQWKGGITDKQKMIRESVEYKEWRLKVYKRDRWTCQKCKKKVKELIAHHIMFFFDYPKLRLDVNNGITLCKSCHFKLHHLKKFTIKLQGNKNY